MGSAGYCVECTDHCAGAHFRSLNRRCATRAAHLSAPPLLPLCHAWHTSPAGAPVHVWHGAAAPCTTLLRSVRLPPPLDLQAVQDQLLENECQDLRALSVKVQGLWQRPGQAILYQVRAGAHGDEREVRQAHLAALPHQPPVGCREAGVDQRVGHQQRRKMREGERQWV